MAYLQTPGAAAALREMAREIFRKDLGGLIAKTAALEMPVRIIWGEQDRMLSVASGRRL